MQRVLASRWAVVVVIAVALGIGLHAVTTGFITDDHVFRVLLHSTSGRAPAAWDLFRFSGGDPETTALAIRFGHTPWWTSPDFRIHFARPLTSLLFAFDDRVFGDNPVGYHLHSLVWFAAFLAAAAACLRRILPHAVATVALAVFAWHAGHSQAYAWPSARHVLVAATPALLALYARLCGRRWLSLALVIVAFAGSELALGIVPFLLAYEILGPERNWRRCIPIVVLALAYLVAYHLLGFGVTDSAGYHDPLGDALGFMRVVPAHFFALLGDALLDVPAELSNGNLAVVLVIVGVIATLAIAALWWWLCRSQTRQYAWVIAGTLGAVIIATTGIPGGRVLALANLGVAVVLATLFDAALERGWLARIAVGLLALVHLVASPLRAWIDIDLLDQRGRASEAIAIEAVELARGRRLFVVAASDPFVFLYPRGIASALDPGAIRCWSVLSAARSTHRLERVDDHTFTLTALHRPLLMGFDSLFRRPDRAITDAADQCGATIRVTELDGGLPSTIEISFRRRLDDPELVFAAWRDGHLVRLELPAVGSAIELPWSPGPARFL